MFVKKILLFLIILFTYNVSIIAQTQNISGIINAYQKVIHYNFCRNSVTVQSSSSRKLLLEFDQTNWKKVRLGDTFRYKIDGDTKEHIGQISKIYSVSNTANRKMKAEVMANDIMVGLYGDGNIITK